MKINHESTGPKPKPLPRTYSFPPLRREPRNDRPNDRLRLHVSPWKAAEEAALRAAAALDRLADRIDRVLLKIESN